MLRVSIVICTSFTSHRRTIICLFILSDVSDFSKFVVVIVVAVVKITDAEE